MNRTGQGIFSIYLHSHKHLETKFQGVSLGFGAKDLFISNFWIRAHRENSFSEWDVTGETLQRDWLKNYLVGVARAFIQQVVCAQPFYRFFLQL